MFRRNVSARVSLRFLALAFLAALAATPLNARAEPAPQPTPQPKTGYVALDLAPGSRVSGEIRAAFAYRAFGDRFVELDSHDMRGERLTALDTGLIGTRRTFLALSNVIRTNADGAPRLCGVLGVGVAALPDFTRRATFSGSVFYYTDVHGTLATAAGPLAQSYKLVTYRLDAAITMPGRPLFLEIGIVGDHFIPKAFAPVGVSHRAVHLGFGIHG